MKKSIILFMAGIIGVLLVALYILGTQPKTTCVFDPVFDRWECCERMENTINGPRCAVGQQVTLLNNEL